jgi:hypothetical protein
VRQSSAAFSSLMTDSGGILVDQKTPEHLFI